jgi:hypothetical protein
MVSASAGLYPIESNKSPGFAESRLGPCATEGEQAAALAEESVRALGDVPELLPAHRGLSVEGRCRGVVADVLGEQGPGRAERMLVKWVVRLEPGDETLRKRRIAGAKRSPHHCR